MLRNLDDEGLDDQATPLRSVVVSSHGDAASWILDPRRQNPDGEWRAGMWASWAAGASWDADSFAELMHMAREFLEGRPSE